MKRYKYRRLLPISVIAISLLFTTIAAFVAQRNPDAGLRWFMPRLSRPLNCSCWQSSGG